MKQCDATTLHSTYSRAHRCLKKTGVKNMGKKNLCPHHRTMEDRKAVPSGPKAGKGKS
ncbi:MAG: hypothetical protein HZB91_04850 [Elusimicrobia bacterium]|nr:hypothetical protein [Elusimicrobiota bacterium]